MLRRSSVQHSWPLLIAVGFVGYYVSRALPKWLQTIDHAAASAGNYKRGTQYRAYEHDFEPIMTRSEALILLGFSDKYSQPSNKEVREMHRKAMGIHHTDVGGSSLISQKINEAKEKLMNSPSYGTR